MNRENSDEKISTGKEKREDQDSGCIYKDKKMEQRLRLLFVAELIWN